MLTSTSLTIVIVDNKGPRLIPRPEPLSDPWDGIPVALQGAVLVVKSDVHLTAFIIGCLEITSVTARVDFKANAYSNHYIRISIKPETVTRRTYGGSQRCS